ncbi:MAG: ferrous iron transport protein A [Acidobacteria bacterium]|nr:ferrous iron transport protein A [Acidobacteriota bacterium]MCW5950409.1 ferrous iron transport protein A [Pyrinomonadaceae bacterium]
MRLDQLSKGKPALVTSVAGDNLLAKRMMEMGIVPGAEVSVVRSAPFGDPIEVRVRGYSLAMRLNEAAAVEIAPIAPIA